MIKFGKNTVDNLADWEFNKELVGTIVEVQLYDTDINPNFKVSVQLESDEKVVRKTFFFDLDINSAFGQFCVNCEVVDEEGGIDFSNLLYSKVIVCLVLTQDNKIIVDYIKKYPGDDYQLVDYSQLDEG